MDEQERFWSRVDRSPGGCWEWTGRRARGGYGEIWWHGRDQRSHRVAWELLEGPIPEGLFVCHHCDNPPCVRTSHLFLGTALDNNRDRQAKGRTTGPGKKTEEPCPKGHTGSFFRVARRKGDPATVRRCRECENAYALARYYRGRPLCECGKPAASPGKLCHACTKRFFEIRSGKVSIV